MMEEPRTTMSFNNVMQFCTDNDVEFKLKRNNHNNPRWAFVLKKGKQKISYGVHPTQFWQHPDGNSDTILRQLMSDLLKLLGEN